MPHHSSSTIALTFAMLLASVSPVAGAAPRPRAEASQPAAPVAVFTLTPFVSASHILPGQVITATATNNLTGRTSEFSAS